jgi:hypothetical protein
MNLYKILKPSVSAPIVRRTIPLLSSPNAVRVILPRIIKTFLLLNVLFLFASQRAGAQQTPTLVGTWYGFYDGISEQMVLQPDGQFSAIEAGFDYYLWMVGNWAQMPGQNVIEFKVTNYEPKTVAPPSNISGGTFAWLQPNISFVFHGFAGPTLVYSRYK